jgi:chemotaxis protein methyltransferase CheR
LEAAFEPEDGAYRLRERFRAAVELRREDVRDTLPRGPFRIVFCRNSIFTYFDEALQQETLERLLAVLAPGGAFVAAPHEKLPPSAPLVPWFPELGIFRRA